MIFEVRIFFFFTSILKDHSFQGTAEDVSILTSMETTLPYVANKTSYWLSLHSDQGRVKKDMDGVSLSFFDTCQSQLGAKHSIFCTVLGLQQTEFLSVGLFQITEMQLNVVICALPDVQFISLGVSVLSGSRDDFYHHIISIQAGLHPKSTRYTSYIGQYWRPIMTHFHPLVGKKKLAEQLIFSPNEVLIIFLKILNVQKSISFSKHCIENLLY